MLPYLLLLPLLLLPHPAAASPPLSTSEERTVHLVWGLWDDGPLPDMWARNVARWTELNPTWTTRLWRRADDERKLVEEAEAR